MDYEASDLPQAVKPMVTLAERANLTTADNPWPLRILNTKIVEYVDKMSALWVEGQITQFTRRPGATMSFVSLRDVETDNSITVSVRQKVLAACNIELTQGTRVVMYAKATFWIKRGSLQLEAHEIRAVGIGALLARLEQLKNALAAEGLFNPERKRPLPFLPQRIGLICGRASAAEHDVLVNAKLRWPVAQFETRTVAVQGNSAVNDVLGALAELEADPRVDVIIITRGGGSVEDLLPFSDERLVRAVAEAQTPIVSAIGHEVDCPLLDLVADLRASTPTDAAKRVVPDYAHEVQLISQCRSRLRDAVGMRVHREQDRLTAVRSRPLFASPHSVFTPHVERLSAATARMRQSISTRFEREHLSIDQLTRRVRAMSPQATLARGYAVVRADAGQIVRDPTQVPAGTNITIMMEQGTLAAVSSGEAASATKTDPSKQDSKRKTNQ